MPTVKTILVEWLKAHGYDGLCAYECGCLVDNLMPCGSCPDNCVPGYNVPLPAGEETNVLFGRGDFWIAERKLC